MKYFLEMTTSPLPRMSNEGEIDPLTNDFSAFVFKIQANMNKAHRDRIAFLRICSGKFPAESGTPALLGVCGLAAHNKMLCKERS